MKLLTRHVFNITFWYSDTSNLFVVSFSFLWS